MDSFKELQDTLGLVEHEMVSIFGAEYMSRDMTIQEHRFIDKIFSDTSKIKVNLLFVVFKQLTDVKAREYLLSQLLMQNSLSSKDLFYLNNYLTFASSKPPEYFLSINSLLKKSDDLYYDYIGITDYKKPQAYTMRWVINNYICSSSILRKMGSSLNNKSDSTTLTYRLMAYMHVDLKELNLLVGTYMAFCLYDDNYITQDIYNLLKHLFGIKDKCFDTFDLEFTSSNDLNVDIADLSVVFSTILNVWTRWQIISTIRYDLDKEVPNTVLMNILHDICTAIDKGELCAFSVDSIDEYCKLLSLKDVDKEKFDCE